ncbi:MAG: T9SS type A sorting domain-containing protein [Bacteroidota bacterium]
MKKIYLLALAAFALTFTANAQLLDENMEFYDLGEMNDQNPLVWSSWSNDGGLSSDGMLCVDTITIDDQSLQSINGGGRDPMLFLGNIASGEYTLRWEFYIPQGKEGYFNIQGTIPPVGTAMTGVFHSGNIYFNEANGNPGGITDTNSDMSNLSFPHDEWFTVDLYVNVDTRIYNMTIGGNTSADGAFNDPDLLFGGINYFPGDATSEYYVDNLVFIEGTFGVDDFSPDKFSVYPNPVEDVLNVQSTAAVQSIEVYDVLGKLVNASTPDIISPTIDMSDLNSGIYLVKVTINGASKTVKVIK